MRIPAALSSPSFCSCAIVSTGASTGAAGAAGAGAAGAAYTPRGFTDVCCPAAVTPIAEFIPYPCNRTEEACVRGDWCMRLDYANLTLRDPDSVAARMLAQGALVAIDDEIFEASG